MIRLTEEKIREIIKPMVMIDPHVIANAQLKQVAEWGDERCGEHWANSRPVRRKCQECWQALLKEVEDAEG